MCVCVCNFVLMVYIGIYECYLAKRILALCSGDAISFLFSGVPGCRIHMGMELTRVDVGDDDALFKVFWHHNDAIVCCAWKVSSQSLGILQI